MALSRALGDFEFKKSADLSPEQQIVTAFPDVVTHEISPDDEFLVIACDGALQLRCFPELQSNRTQAFGIAKRLRLSLNSLEEVSQRNRSCTKYVKT